MQDIAFVKERDTDWRCEGQTCGLPAEVVRCPCKLRGSVGQLWSGGVGLQESLLQPNESSNLS